MHLQVLQCCHTSYARVWLCCFAAAVTAIMRCTCACGNKPRLVQTARLIQVLDHDCAHEHINGACDVSSHCCFTSRCVNLRTSRKAVLMRAWSASQARKSNMHIPYRGDAVLVQRAAAGKACKQRKLPPRCGRRELSRSVRALSSSELISHLRISCLEGQPHHAARAKGKA